MFLDERGCTRSAATAELEEGEAMTDRENRWHRTSTWSDHIMIAYCCDGGIEGERWKWPKRTAILRETEVTQPEWDDGWGEETAMRFAAMVADADMEGAWEILSRLAEELLKERGDPEEGEEDRQRGCWEERGLPRHRIGRYAG